MPLLLLLSHALASDGAYVVGPGDASLFVGLDAERITKLAGGEGSYDPSVAAVDDGLSKLTGKLIVSYGLAPRTELQLTLPYGYNHANTTSGPLCTALGADTCKATSGVGVIGTQAKFVVLDELNGAPLSFTVGGLARFGQLTWATRNRITNLGEGTFDVGGVVGLGRSGGLGRRGYWTTSLTADQVYRFPNTTIGGEPAPGFESSGYADVMFTPTGTWTVGPQVAWFFRPGGVDIESADPTNPDWLASLRVQKVAAGASVYLRARNGLVFDVGALRNLWAVNNPADGLLVSVGVQANGLTRKKAE